MKRGNDGSKSGKIHCISEGARPSDVARVMFSSWLGGERICFHEWTQWRSGGLQRRGDKGRSNPSHDCWVWFLLFCGNFYLLVSYRMFLDNMDARMLLTQDCPLPIGSFLQAYSKLIRRLKMVLPSQTKKQIYTVWVLPHLLLFCDMAGVFDWAR